MLVVIVVMVPLTVPKLFGYNIYAVLTESMTPAYSVGSVVYVRTCEPEEVEVGDAITFQMGTNTDNVMTHRVVEIDEEDGLFRTKGDANAAVDAEPVVFERLLGKVVLSIPGLANVSNFVNTTTGKAVLFIAFASAFILWVMADMLAPKKKNPDQAVERKRSRGRRSATQTALYLVGSALIIGALVYLGNIFLQYEKGESEYEALHELVFENAENTMENAPIEDDSVQDAEMPDRVQLTESDKQVMRAIGGLKEQNEDVIGWIVFDNMELSYPIMQGEDNEYYLSHTFSRESNSAGSIFMEAANTPDFQDCHTIIYGHNMKNLSMFGQLKKYKTEQFYEEHQYFTIYTEEHVYRYQIFAYYDISEIGDIYTIGFRPNAEFRQFINNMMRRSYYDTDVEVTEQDKVITLSTCSTEGNRFVVNAKRIEEK